MPKPVALALLHHLGIARHDGHPGQTRRHGHRQDDPLQVRQRKPFLEDERRREIKRPRTRHRNIVDRTVDREAADVAAGKEQRRYDMAVGCDHHAAGGHRNARAVVLRAQPLVVESTQKQLVDELRGGATAAPVRHVHPTVLEIDRTDVVGADHAHAVTALTMGTFLNRP
jgi:hypothetical protein